MLLNTNISPWYLDLNQILNGLKFIMVPGLLALALTVIVLQGEIDISLPSQVAVGTVLLGFLATQGTPYLLAVPIVLVVGALLGAFNGIVVTSFGLPSMAVTFGTLWAYRGLAYLLPDGEYGYASTAFDEVYFWIGGTKLGGALPVGLIILGVVAFGIGLLVHRTTYGRWTYAIGNNSEAARFSGIRVGLVKTGAYALGGVIAALGALIFVGQYQSARGDNMEGQLLFIVAAVVLGGIDLMGGKGHVIGVVLSDPAAGHAAQRHGPRQHRFHHPAAGLRLAAGGLRPHPARRPVGPRLPSPACRSRGRGQSLSAADDERRWSPPSLGLVISVHNDMGGSRCDE